MTSDCIYDDSGTIRMIEVLRDYVFHDHLPWLVGYKPRLEEIDTTTGPVMIPLAE